MLSLVVLLLAAPAVHASSWRRPVDGPVLRAFNLGADPYAPGQHRGVDLGAPPGSPVRGACAGRVRFAGRVPGGGRTVSVRCGEIVATYQQLGTIAVRVGQRIAPGAALGFVGRSSDPRTRRPHLHLGAREAATGRYVDPLMLLRGTPPAVPLLPPAGGTRPRIAAPRRAPIPASPRAVSLARAPAPALPHAVPLGHAPGPALPHTAPLDRAPAPASPRAVPLGHAPAPAWPRAAQPSADSPRAASPGPAPTLPLVVWVGLAGIGLALPVGGIVGVRRHRRATSGRAVAATR
ncbi:MAG: hypothetical protein QOI11_380 [Candidatus Eremiobacteraeota bacterium]|nr:hypothetical protein [Candidatus Eremiobacteraeota bacterium]